TRSTRDWSSDVCSSDLVARDPRDAGQRGKRVGCGIEERHGFAGALPSVGGYGGPFRGPPSSSDSGRAELTKPYGEERIEQRGGGDQGHVGALTQQVVGALDGGDAADGEDRAVPGAGLPPREHLLDLPRGEGPRVGADDRRAVAPGALERGVALLVDHAAAHAVRHDEAARPRGQLGGRLVPDA